MIRAYCNECERRLGYFFRSDEQAEEWLRDHYETEHPDLPWLGVSDDHSPKGQPLLPNNLRFP